MTCTLFSAVAPSLEMQWPCCLSPDSICRYCSWPLITKGSVLKSWKPPPSPGWSSMQIYWEWALENPLPLPLTTYMLQWMKTLGNVGLTPNLRPDLRSTKRPNAAAARQQPDSDVRPMLQRFAFSASIIHRHMVALWNTFTGAHGCANMSM